MNNKWLTVGIIAAVLLSAGFTGFAMFKVRAADNVYDEAAQTYNEVAENYTKPKENAEPKTGPEKKDILYEQAPIEVDFEELQKTCTNGNVVGWLYCEDTLINYPVVCGTNNVFYLDHLIDGTYNVSGTLFMDCANDENWADKNTIIYGHHMGDGSMFGLLQKFRIQDYAKEHPYMWLMTPTADYKLEYLGCYVTDTESMSFNTKFNTSEFKEFLEYTVKSFYYPIDKELSLEDRLVSLSTCSYESNNVRQITVLRIMTQDELRITEEKELKDIAAPEVK